MTPKHKAIVKHMGGGYTDANGIKHLTKAEQKAKSQVLFKGMKPVSHDFKKEMSRGDTFEGEAKMKNKKY